MKWNVKFLILLFVYVSLIVLFYIYFNSNIKIEAIQHFCLFNLRKLEKLEKETIFKEVKSYILEIEFIKEWSFGENVIHPNEFILKIVFNNQEELNAYKIHPSHRKFVNFLKNYYQKNHTCLDWKLKNILKN
jgi:hypothetical protein